MILPAFVNRVFATISAVAIVASTVLMSMPMEVFQGTGTPSGNVLLLER